MKSFISISPDMVERNTRPRNIPLFSSFVESVACGEARLLPFPSWVFQAEDGKVVLP